MSEQEKDQQTPRPPEQQSAQPEQPPEAQARPKDTFKQGLGLLWQAARSAADEIKREVEKGGVTDAIQQAGRDLEDAANQASKALEGLMERVGPTKPKYSDAWPPPENPRGASPQGAPTKDGPALDNEGQPPDLKGDGGVDHAGEARDMRIQLDEDEPKS